MSGAACFTSIFVSSLCTPNSRMPITLLRALATTQCFNSRDRNVGKCCRGSSKTTFTCHADVGTTITSSSFDGYQYGRLLPCPLENGPPRVEHLVVSEGGPVLEFISRALNLSPIFVADLIQFGAVYYALVCPEPPPTATPEQIKLFKEATSPSALKKRLSVKGKTVREAQKAYLINHIHEFVEAGTYIRVRVHPKRFPPGPPRVEHLVVSEGGSVLEFISRSLNLPPIFVADLIQFGAVYYALVCPEPPPTATPEHIKLFKEITSPSVLKKRLSVKGKTVREAQKTFRINHIHEFVEAGTYIRVHVHPKRFPRCYEIDWKSRIIAVEESFVVLDKPAGTSVGGTTDNIEETCATFATRALSLAAPLKTTHQIDNCTEGCVVLARTKEYCSVFHGKIREKSVKKLYRALAAAAVPCGIMSHYMRPVNVAPRLVSEDFHRGWHLCQLEVLECTEVPWPNAVIQGKYFVDDCGWPSKDVAYECKINLLTGRTHQIRAQFAACGAPIVGDSMYIPAVMAERSNPGVNPFGKYGKLHTTEVEKANAEKEWMAQHGKEPSVAIGLQAYQISWDEGEYIYEAGSPWWR